jgi:DNA primase
MKGCRPFHSEKTPSFYVYEDGHYHCFGSGAHGDAIGFVDGSPTRSSLVVAISGSHRPTTLVVGRTSPFPLRPVPGASDAISESAATSDHEPTTRTVRRPP